MTDVGQGTNAELPLLVVADVEVPADLSQLAPASVEPPRFRRIRLAVCYVAAAVSVLATLLVAGAWRDDLIIDADRGVTHAEVLSAGRLRSAIFFVTPDGQTHTPKLGVLYPTNLTVGQTINVEYAKGDPDLVRVAGRDARVALVPAGSVIAMAWLAAITALVLLRRAGRPRGVSDEH